MVIFRILRWQTSMKCDYFLNIITITPSNIIFGVWDTIGEIKTVFRKNDYLGQKKRCASPFWEARTYSGTDHHHHCQIRRTHAQVDTKYIKICTCCNSHKIFLYKKNHIQLIHDHRSFLSNKKTGQFMNRQKWRISKGSSWSPFPCPIADDKWTLSTTNKNTCRVHAPLLKNGVGIALSWIF